MHNLRTAQERNQSRETNAHCQLKQTDPIQLYFGSVIIFKLFLRECVYIYIFVQTHKTMDSFYFLRVRITVFIRYN